MIMRMPGLFVFLFLVIPMVSFAQDDPFSPVVQAIEAADAKKVAAMFNETVELSFPGKDNTCSVAQGEMIMKDFFRNNPPEKFTIIRTGTTDAHSRFAIAEYQTAGKTLQAYIHLRRVSNKFLIQKMKFEDKRN